MRKTRLAHPIFPRTVGRAEVRNETHARWFLVPRGTGLQLKQSTIQPQQKMKTTKSLLLASLLMFATALTSTASILLNFDSVAAGSGVDATSYLASFGITLTNVSSGSVDIFSDQNFYGSGVVAASSPHNFLLHAPAGGAPNGATYTLNFSTPLTSVSFTRIAQTTSNLVAQWSATAFAGATPVASVGENLFGGTEGSQAYTLSGTGITSLTITANGNNVAGVPSVPLDDLWLTSGPSECKVSVTGVEMFDAHTLEIDVTGQFNSDPLSEKTLSVSTTVGNVALNGSFPITPGSIGSQSTSFFFDLTANNIPRFTDNMTFVVTPGQDENGNGCNGTPQQAIILLPAVIIPGIFSGDGGDGTFPDLEDTLRTVLAGDGLLIGRFPFCKSYQLTTDVVGYPTIGYPTLFTLSYRTSTSSFQEAAIDLNALLKQIKTVTYADKVNIVTHSKGGLVARQYLVGGYGSVGVKQLIMTVPPNLGATGASWSNLDPTGLKVNLSNLLPVWPWNRKSLIGIFVTAKPVNKELDALNKLRLPNGVLYTTIYSDSLPTVFTETDIKQAPPILTFTPGDGVVPTFSMLGSQVDPNNPNAVPAPIQAFTGVPINFIDIAGFHAGYLEQPAVMQQVVNLLIP